MKSKIVSVICVLSIITISGLASCKKKSGDDLPAKSSACDITSFTVDGKAWDVNGTSITSSYPKTTAETPMSPVITLSKGATVNPPSGAPQNFFTAQVSYTVTAEDGVSKKTYMVKAAKN